MWPFVSPAEAGPDGARLFRIRLVAGPISGGSIASPRFGGFAGVGGATEGISKTYILAATSFREAQAWATAIREVADWTDHSRERSLDRSFSSNGSLELQRGRQSKGVPSGREEALPGVGRVEPSRRRKCSVSGIAADPALRVGSVERRGSRAGDSVGRKLAFATAATKAALKQKRSSETNSGPSPSYPGSANSVHAMEEAKSIDEIREEGFPHWLVAFAVVAAAAVLILLERLHLMLPLGWVGVAAGSVGTLVAIATDRSRIRKQNDYLEQMLRDALRYVFLVCASSGVYWFTTFSR